MNYIVVTKQAEFVKFLKEIGKIRDGEYEVYPYIKSVNTIRDKHVIGHIPIPIAAYTASVTIYPMRIPARLRNKVDARIFKKHAGLPITYRITAIPSEGVDDGSKN